MMHLNNIDLNLTNDVQPPSHRNYNRLDIPVTTLINSDRQQKTIISGNNIMNDTASLSNAVQTQQVDSVGISSPMPKNMGTLAPPNLQMQNIRSPNYSPVGVVGSEIVNANNRTNLNTQNSHERAFSDNFSHGMLDDQPAKKDQGTLIRIENEYDSNRAQGL